MNAPDQNWRGLCLMCLTEGLGVSMCSRESYIDEDEPHEEAFDLLPEDLVQDAAHARLTALRILRRADAAGFTKVYELALLFAGERLAEALPLADAMFTVISARDLVEYAVMCEQGGAA